MEALRMKDTGQIVIYSRKSKFTGKGESIENQIEMCKQYIRLHFGEKAAGDALVYEDEGFSGGNLERPQFKKMMAEAKEKDVQAIVVYRLDRISRNIGDFAKLIEKLNDMRIDFISIKEQFDTASPMGRAMMYISSVFSQLERETIAERIRDNMHELSKTGRWLGGVPPTGYRSESVSSVTIDGKTKKACKLRAIPEELSLVKLIFDKFLETGSLTKTETYLLQNGYTTKNGKQFTRFAIKGLLSNPVYMIADEFAYNYLTEKDVDLFSDKSEFDGVHGVMAYNRTLQQPGKANKIKPMEEWIVSVGKHEGAIEGATWIKVQSLLERNKSKSYKKPRSNVALLSGLLVCGNCGDYMRPKTSQRLNTKGEPIYTYLCSTKERSRCHICNMKNCNGNILDADIIEQIKSLSEDHSDFFRQLERSKRILTGDRQEYDNEIAQLKNKISENETEIKGIVSALGKAAGTAAEDYMIQQIDELHQKGESIKRRLVELEELTTSNTWSEMEFDLLAQMLSTFKNTVDEMTVEQKRTALRTIVKQVIWDGQDAHVVLFGSDYKYEFPETPIGIKGIEAENGEKENFDGTAERGDAEPLREYSK
jgi:DNA invertase Pin-like site-specific DNA recombinase